MLGISDHAMIKDENVGQYEIYTFKIGDILAS